MEIFFSAFALSILTLVVAGVYYLTRRFYYRLAVRTRYLTLYIELFILLWLPAQNQPLLTGKIEGYWFLVSFVLFTIPTLREVWRGKNPDMLLLLLLPLVPALIALGLDYRRNRRASSK